MIVAYARVSTDKQDAESFARERGYDIDYYITEDGLDLNTLRRYDTLILRSLADLDDGKMFGYVPVVLDLIQRDVTVVTIRENLVLKNDIQSTILVSVHGLAAQVLAETYDMGSEVTSSSASISTDEDERVDVLP